MSRPVSHFSCPFLAILEMALPYLLLHYSFSLLPCQRTKCATFGISFCFVWELKHLTIILERFACVKCFSQDFLYAFPVLSIMHACSPFFLLSRIFTSKIGYCPTVLCFVHFWKRFEEWGGVMAEVRKRLICIAVIPTL